MLFRSASPVQLACLCHRHVQPIGAHIKAVGPSGRAKVKKNAREIGHIMQGFNHWSLFAFEQEGKVVNAFATVTEVDMKLVGRDDFYFDYFIQHQGQLSFPTAHRGPGAASFLTIHRDAEPPNP